MKGLKTWFFSWIFPWFPKRLLSRAVGVFMRIPLIWPLPYILIPLFARFFKINTEEAEFPCGRYRSFDHYFTRKLKAGLRPIEGEIVHPADSVLTETGIVQAGHIVQAKGWNYPVAEFLGDDELAEAYEGGTFATYYLCPADYHRVHASAGGELYSARHIPGLLWPVNDWSVNNIRRLFCLNERVVLNFKSPRGRFSMVLVGATNVGHMTITHDPSITTNRWMWHAPTDRNYSPPIPIKAGDEVGIFHLGSTVICLYEKGFGITRPSPGPVKFGQQIASLKAADFSAHS